ncbi:MAG: hypothetical protein VYC39_10175 [Myxococcota bacterium]|nr:hypothetical protein [Myxococcota bacterium]
MRQIDCQYSDALDVIWTTTAARLGFKIARSTDVFASSDGLGTLTLSTSNEFDADDSLAQLIFHELCHAIVEGPESRHQKDWGLDNTGDKDIVREHACHRVQAALSQQFGLRRFFGVTTEWRAYYDALPKDPLEIDSDPASQLASEAIERFRNSCWHTEIKKALSSTAIVAGVVQEYSESDSLWATFEPATRSD